MLPTRLNNAQIKKSQGSQEKWKIDNNWKIVKEIDLIYYEPNRSSRESLIWININNVLKINKIGGCIHIMGYWR